MRLILLGYMGSGKSSIGKILSNTLHVPLIDLDEHIVSHEKMSIADIFKDKGEIYFRRKETEYLSELLLHKDNFILAVGGGRMCYGNKMNIIKSNSIYIYLKSSINTIYDRVSNEKNKSKRPLISEIKNDDLKEFIAKHLFERSPYYEKANFTIITDHKTQKEVAEEISSNMQ